MNAVAADLNMPIFDYNEAFDEEHYPAKDFMIDILIKVHQRLNMPHEGRWVYFATIHGVIFKFDFSEYQPQSWNQLGPEELKFFAELPNLRYIDVKDNSFSFALTHYEDEVPQ